MKTLRWIIAFIGTIVMSCGFKKNPDSIEILSFNSGVFLSSADSTVFFGRKIFIVTNNDSKMIILPKRFDEVNSTTGTDESIPKIRHNYFVFTKEADSGILYGKNPFDTLNSYKKFEVKEFLQLNDIKTDGLKFLDYNTGKKVATSRSKNLLIEKYISGDSFNNINKAFETRIDSVYHVFDSNIKTTEFTLSNKFDSNKWGKLVRVVFIYGKSHNTVRKLEPLKGIWEISEDKFSQEAITRYFQRYDKDKIVFK